MNYISKKLLKRNEKENQKTKVRGFVLEGIRNCEKVTKNCMKN
jgi:hypothetical protein